MIPLVTRSHYSLMWGTAPVDWLCRVARLRGYTALALTDTDNLYGLWPFVQACQKEGLRPIVGAEVTDKASRRRAVCLVETDTGYSNLCRLLTLRHTHDDFDLATMLPEYANGLSVLVQDADLLANWRESVPVLVAAMPRRPSSALLRLRDVARKLDLPIVATPGAFFLDAEDHAFHKLLRAIGLNTSLSRLPKSEVAPPDAWLASSSVYTDRFAAIPETIRHTHMVAERCAFDGPSFGTVLPPWSGANGKSADDQLREEAYQGAKQRYGELSEDVVERLDYELRIIAEKSFSSYFLVVRDIVRLSPRICGRGSGAASLVAYCLGITNVCPMKFNLYFERFLNPGRQDPPDIDVDFAWDERDDVLAKVLACYDGHAAMVCNHVFFQPRMAIRETAKVFGLTASEIGQVSKRLPWFWRAMNAEGPLIERLRKLPQLRELDFPEPWPEVLRLAQQLIGTPRHLSVHSGGVVITPRPISDYVPIEKAPKGVPIIQWEKDGTEDSGLVKIDLLGNRSLGVIRDAIEGAREAGESFDEAGWEPEDDIATQQLIAKGDTMGCFYIESPATRLLQQKAKVGDYEHIVIHSSIIRPAANDYIREYIRRLHGGEWEPIHPLMGHVLDETYGIMVYQEDVAKTAVALAGFSHEDADGLRKIMSKKSRLSKLMDYRARFEKGARERGVLPDQIEAIWQMMRSFEGYSFCKPHSASYARVSFQAAFLKRHFPAAFMAAVISNQGGFYSTFAYVSEARRLGVQILPPSVSISRIRWHAETPEAIRVGLMAIKGLGFDTMNRILDEREERSFRNFSDFLTRVRPAEDEARAMIHCGALDALAPRTSRTTRLWELAHWQKARVAPTPHHADLFDHAPGVAIPDLPASASIEELRREYAIFGFLCDRHPVTLYEKEIARQSPVKACRVSAFVGKRIRFIGWMISGKTVSTKSGDPMKFLTFEDETGLLETVFFPKAYRRFCASLDYHRPYVLLGQVEEDFGATTLTVDYSAPLKK